MVSPGPGRRKTEGQDASAASADGGAARFRAPDADYHAIGGTYVFDGERSQAGYQLNMLLLSLRDSASRASFVADEAAYLDSWDLTPEQRTAVLERRWVELLRLGMNMFAGGILAAIDGRTIQSVGSEMAGMTEEDFGEMLRTGRRSDEGVV